jgi:hypothetical protein
MMQRRRLAAAVPPPLQESSFITALHCLVLGGCSGSAANRWRMYLPPALQVLHSMFLCISCQALLLLPGQQTHTNASSCSGSFCILSSPGSLLNRGEGMGGGWGRLGSTMLEQVYHCS